VGVKLAVWSLPDHCPQCSAAYPWVAQSSRLDNVSSALARIERACERFQLIAKRLVNRYGRRQPLLMSDEYDVQYLLGAVLAADFDDIRDEEFSPSVAGQNARIDFVLVEPAIAVETKMTRASLTDAKLGEELLADIRRYEEHPSVRHLVCLVYDPALLLKNPAGLVRDLEKTSTRLASVRVIIVPRGT
jgi:hypothetical protein